MIGTEAQRAEALAIHRRYGAGASRWITERLVALAAMNDFAAFQQLVEIASDYQALVTDALQAPAEAPAAAPRRAGRFHWLRHRELAAAA